MRASLKWIIAAIPCCSLRKGRANSGIRLARLRRRPYRVAALKLRVPWLSFAPTTATPSRRTPRLLGPTHDCFGRLQVRLCFEHHSSRSVTHVLSILDPEWPEPDAFSDYPQWPSRQIIKCVGQCLASPTGSRFRPEHTRQFRRAP